MEITKASNAVSAGTSDVNGTGFAMAGYENILFIAVLGDVTDTATLEAKDIRRGMPRFGAGNYAANLQRLPESLAREVMIDPSVHDDGLSPAALHFARASCQAYEVTFASLYALWLRAFELKARQQFYFSLTGFMAVVFAGVANLTARTPATAHRAVLMGPTFETLRAVPTPRTRDHACTMIVERIVDLQRTLAQPLPRGIEGGPTQTWYRERIASLKAPIARYLEQVKTLATSN